ncbi:MAG: nuclear transport factor 2 family protein [Cyanothece sp. SIO1E1]|nr:nuclear transport factor 2 family protein [Cyanothece sp. SIO1E1]
MDKRGTVEKWFKEVWAEEKEHVILELFVPDNEGLAHGMAKDKGMKPEDYIGFHRALLGLLKNVRIKIDHFHESGDTAIAECTMTGEGRTSGTPVSIKGCAIAEITDGKIRSANNYFDFLKLFEELELLPEDTFAKCLSGVSLR